MQNIIITSNKINITAELNNSSTAQVILDALPFSGTVNRWGDEIYFKIPVHAEQETGVKEEMSQMP
jgi:hypothetical protein